MTPAPVLQHTSPSTCILRKHIPLGQKLVWQSVECTAQFLKAEFTLLGWTGTLVFLPCPRGFTAPAILLCPVTGTAAGYTFVPQPLSASLTSPGKVLTRGCVQRSVMRPPTNTSKIIPDRIGTEMGILCVQNSSRRLTFFEGKRNQICFLCIQDTRLYLPFNSAKQVHTTGLIVTLQLCLFFCQLW